MQKGQTDILAVIILIGAVLVIGASFLGILTPAILNLISQNDLRSILYNEQSMLVLYEEFRDNNRICIGILRIEPDMKTYAIAILTNNFQSIIREGNEYTISFPTNTQLQLQAYIRTIPASKVYYMVEGEYYKVGGTGSIDLLYLPEEMTRNYIAKGTPIPICIKKPSIDVTLYIFYQIGSELYEVSRVKI